MSIIIDTKGTPSIRLYHGIRNTWTHRMSICVAPNSETLMSINMLQMIDGSEQSIDSEVLILNLTLAQQSINHAALMMDTTFAKESVNLVALTNNVKCMFA